MKGRSLVPASYMARVDQANARYTAQAEAIHAAIAALPERVSLKDGRLLMVAERWVYQKSYRCLDGMAVVVSVDATPHGLLRHLKVRYAKRDPRWNDLKLLRAAFFPADRDVLHLLPCEEDSIHVDQHCFHLFEAPHEWQGGWFV
jgi:hypothetical protein